MNDKDQVTLRREQTVIPTYPVGEAEKLPYFYQLRNYQNARGDIYPLAMSESIGDEKEDRAYDRYVLENEYLRVSTLPELGGRVYEGYDKAGDYDFVYKNRVIKPALIGLCGPWISGGIEFNWPQHHRPTTFGPTDAVAEENEDGSKTVWMGEIDPKSSMKSMVGVTVCPGKSYLKVKVKLFNRTPFVQTFHWWANLAVAVNDAYRVIFPPDIDYVTSHYKPFVLPLQRTAGDPALAAGQEEDISWYRNVHTPASYFIFNSNYSFMGGYDYEKQRGTVHIADRHISPGKKFYTWGNGVFGDVWQKNLTDEDGPYIEIMTGVYTDNQPDFSWLLPYESKEFEQVWYGVQELPDLKNAGVDGAVSLRLEGTKAWLAFNVTANRPAARYLLRHGERILAEGRADLAPDHPFRIEVEGGEELQWEKIFAALYDAGGEELISYEQKPMYFDGKEAPRAHEPARFPADIETVEELFLNGLHIEQYRHATREPDPYYLEGLRRDPYDIRCNTAMGRREYRRGNFALAKEYLEKAVKRSVSRNPNPYDGEPCYQLGLAERKLGHLPEALDALQKAAWNYAWHSAAMLESARIETARGRETKALEYVERSLDTNRWNRSARCLKTALLRRCGRLEEAERTARETCDYDPLDWGSLYELARLLDQAGQSGEAAEKRAFLRSVFGNRPDECMEVAGDYLSSGLYQEAEEIVSFCPETYPLRHYYRGYAQSMMGDPASIESFRKADACPIDYCFPNRDMEFDILSLAMREDPAGARAPYYLGNIYYARANTARAAECWEESKRRDGRMAVVHRNLALLDYEKLHDGIGAAAEMEQAFALEPENPRLLFELLQLYRVMKKPAGFRLALMEAHKELIFTRNDLSVEYIKLLNLTGNYEKARETLASHIYHTYEGGEGLLPAQHVLTYIHLAQKARREGRYDETLACLEAARVYPENYNEGKKFQNRENHIDYENGLTYAAMGKAADAQAQFRRAAERQGMFRMDQIEFYRGLALRQIGEHGKARELFEQMAAQGEEERTKDGAFGYFDGFPVGQPFDEDMAQISRMHTESALVYGYAGLGRLEDAMAAYERLARITIDGIWQKEAIDYAREVTLGRE